MTDAVPSPDLLEQAATWLAEDPDEQTRAELSSLTAAARSGDEAAQAELVDAFRGTLQFGTAGLRGRLGPGTNRMNRVVVARAAAGLAAYLRDTGGHSVVIGFDARHNSDVFAHDTAQIMAGAGISATVLPHALPTPVLAFAIHHLGVSAGVMVTASHNPPQDNGYKVYLADGAQIVSPADVDISAQIAKVGPYASIPRSDDYVTLDNSVVDAYVATACHLLGDGPRDVRVLYTPMHGVGGDVFVRTVTASGFPQPEIVAEQFAPDPDFPTVHFPNPEEPGAMDLALARAAGSDVDVIVANDPDADRCAVGIPSTDGWRMLTGDELGSLLGWWMVQRRTRTSNADPGVFAQSIVSGSLLRSIAEQAGLGYAVTLTGFKWISRVPGLVYGYEEALGYCVDPEHVTDKDGITAALVFLELAAHMRSQDRTIQDVLDELARAHGVHLTAQVSMRVSDLSLIADAMARLRDQPPTHLGPFAVDRVDDLSAGVNGLPPTDGLRLSMGHARVIVRPSGTEPKIKCYLQVIVDVDDDLDHAKRDAARQMDELRRSVESLLAL